MFRKNIIQDVFCNDWEDLACVVSENLKTQVKALKRQKRTNFIFAVLLFAVLHDLLIISKRSTDAKSLAEEGKELYFNHKGRIEGLEKEIDDLRNYIQSIDEGSMKWCAGLSDDIRELKEKTK